MEINTVNLILLIVNTIITAIIPLVHLALRSIRKSKCCCGEVEFRSTKDLKMLENKKQTENVHVEGISL